jgi:hypothetical protein
MVWALGQSMACQSTLSWDAAPAALAAVLCFASSVCLPNALVTKDPLEVSPLAREASASIRSITKRLSLAPSSPTPTSSGFPYGSLSLTGGVWAYHVPYRYHLNGLGPACSPVVVLSTVRHKGVAYT